MHDALSTVKMDTTFMCLFGLSLTVTFFVFTFKKKKPKDFSFHPHQEHSWICPICV